MTTITDAKKMEHVFLAPFQALVKLLASPTIAPLVQELQNLNSRLETLRATVHTAAQPFSDMKSSVDNVITAVTDLKDQLGPMGKRLEEVHKASKEQLGIVASVALFLGSGILSSLLATGILIGGEKFRESSAFGRIRRAGRRGRADDDAGQAPPPSKGTAPPANPKGGLGKKSKIIIGALIAGGLATFANHAFAATEGVEALSGAAEGLSGTLGHNAQSAEAFSGTVAAVLDGLITAGPILAVAGSAFSGLGAIIKAVGVAAMANPVLAVIAGIAAGAAVIIANREGISGFFSGLFDGVGEAISEVFDGIGQTISGALDSIRTTFSGWADAILALIPDWLKDLLGMDGGRGAAAVVSEALSGLGEALTDALPSVDGITGGLSKAGGRLKEFGSDVFDGIGGFLGFGSGDASSGISPFAAATLAGPVDNRSETTINGGITVQTAAADASGIARDIRGALERRLANTHNPGVKQRGSQ